MKKILIAFLISLSCACVATGCSLVVTTSEHSGYDSNASDEEHSSAAPESSSSAEDTTPGTLAVDFVEGEGYTFVSDVKDGALLKEGDVLSFTVDMSVFYTGYVMVAVNGKTVAPDNDGVYNVEMTEAVKITVSGIYKEISNMVGSGSFDDAFVVSRPVDLLYIAEQVNKGVYEYVTGAYVLANDIDCGGEALDVIGDLSTENSFFSGCFTCMTDPDTGEMQRYTISNFTINTDDTNYVGLFGTVYADLSVTSSGLFYGIRLENFAINASIGENSGLESRSIAAGGLIGYGVGVNMYLCDAVNGTVNVYGDDSYFSFAGGLMGYQQAFYMAEYDTYFPSEIVYSTADVDVRIMKGMGLYAGGISGYLATNTPAGAAAFIHNSYATGDVSGAIRAGGVVGGLGQYTSVSNCYATGNVFAKSTQSLDDLLISSTEYCYSYAGGLIGFAENDTIVNDSFFAGTISASAVSAGCAHTDPYVGGGYDKAYASASSQAYIVDNCIDQVDLNDNAFFTDALNWGSYDWVFARNAYPTICYDSPEGTVSATMLLNYVTRGENGAEEVKVNGATYTSAEFFNTDVQSTNVYAPIGNFFVSGGLGQYLRADNGYLSYGYYFDEACTKKVPYSYVPQKNITLYIGFADPSPVLGSYELAYKGGVSPLTLVLDSYAIATYSDGATSQQAYFSFDGETLLIEGARLARYYDGAIVVDETDTSVIADAYFDMYRYSYYDFVGKLVNGGLAIYDGVYFTESAPLLALKDLFRGEYYTADGAVYKFYGTSASRTLGKEFSEYDNYTVENGVITLGDITVNEADLIPFDEFKGAWVKSATVNKIYTFDGMGGWSYEYKSYERNGYSYEVSTVEQRSGSYTVENGVLSLTGTDITASFNSDGYLVIDDNDTKQIYYAENSNVGTWRTNGLTVNLLGINRDGVGKATATYDGVTVYDLVYETSETDGYAVLYWPHDVYTKDTVFGYFVYDTATNTLLSTVYDPNDTSTGYTQVNLFVVDDYNGEWICDADEFLNVEFSFNGNGLYGFLYGYAGMEGELMLRENGEEITLTYTLDSTLKGKFAYNGKQYTMVYDEDLKAVRLTASGENGEAVLERKDALAKTEFVDLAGNSYYFDGRSHLSTGGVLTVNGETEYVYRATENGWKIYENDAEIGSIVLAGNRYAMTVNGNESELYIANEFMGEWAIGGEFAIFSIGPTDLNGTIQADFKGHSVELTVLEQGLLTFRYREDNMPITYYVFVVSDAALGYDVLVLSQYANLYSGGYIICTRANEMYGEWTRNDGAFTVRFDGVTSGSFSNGVAALSRGGAGQTDYYYSIREKGMMMWSQALLGGRTLYYKLAMLDMATATDEELNAADVYVKKDENGNVIGAFRRVEVDGLYLTEATSADGTTYFFDGEGNLYVGDEIAYTYVIRSYNTDSTATLEITDENGVTYRATLHYADASNITLTIGEVIENE